MASSACGRPRSSLSKLLRSRHRGGTPSPCRPAAAGKILADELGHHRRMGCSSPRPPPIAASTRGRLPLTQHAGNRHARPRRTPPKFTAAKRTAAVPGFLSRWILDHSFWRHEDETCDDFSMALQTSQTGSSRIFEKEPLSLLESEFVYKAMKDKPNMLLANYSTYRKVLGDGSCFYTSFIYSYLEQLVKASPDEELRLLHALEPMLEKFQRLHWPDSYSDGYNAFVGLILECMQQLRQTLSVSDYEDWLFQEIQNEQKFTGTIEICTEPEKYRGYIAEPDRGNPDLVGKIDMKSSVCLLQLHSLYIMSTAKNRNVPWCSSRDSRQRIDQQKTELTSSGNSAAHGTANRICCDFSRKNTAKSLYRRILGRVAFAVLREPFAVLNGGTAKIQIPVVRETVIPIDAEVEQEVLVALTGVLRVPLQIVNIDISGIAEPNTHIIYESTLPLVPCVTLLYRPGHYDILYQ